MSWMLIFCCLIKSNNKSSGPSYIGMFILYGVAILPSSLLLFSCSGRSLDRFFSLSSLWPLRSQRHPCKFPLSSSYSTRTLLRVRVPSSLAPRLAPYSNRHREFPERPSDCSPISHGVRGLGRST